MTSTIPATPFAYFGSKARLAPRIVGLFPPHRVYVEPFCGSAAVLFSKRPAQHEIINDRFGDVVNFFRVLRSRGEELTEAIRLTPFARDEFEDAWANLSSGAVGDVERARCFFVRSCQSVNGTGAFRRSGWSAGKSQHTSKAHAARRRADALPRFAERLRAVTVEHGDALDVLDAHDFADAVAYVDPPYLGSTRHSVQQGGAGEYAVEFLSDDDHRTLAARLTDFRGTVVLSGYDSPLYRRLYRGWDRLSIATLRTAGNRPGAAAPRSAEVLWSNRPMCRQQALWSSMERGREGRPRCPRDAAEKEGPAGLTSLLDIKEEREPQRSPQPPDHQSIPTGD